MRLCLVLLALSTLAAAGPLPPFSKTALEARAPPSTPANYTLGPDAVAALTQLKGVYDSLNQKRTEGDIIAKRDIWQWIKDMLKAPGLKARSSVSPSTPDNNTIDAEIVAVLTQLKAIYDNLNEKRMEGGLNAKRDIWQWLKDAFEAPGLKTRSSDDHSLSDSDRSDAVETERTCAGVSGFKGPVLPRGDYESQGGCLGQKL